MSENAQRTDACGSTTKTRISPAGSITPPISRFFERGRTEWLRALGSPQRLADNGRRRFAVTKLQSNSRRGCHRRSLEVVTELTGIKGAVLSFKQHVHAAASRLVNGIGRRRGDQRQSRRASAARNSRRAAQARRLRNAMPVGSEDAARSRKKPPDFYGSRQSAPPKASVWRARPHKYRRANQSRQQPCCRSSRLFTSLIVPVGCVEL